MLHSDNRHYSLSFTTASARVPETLKIAKLYDVSKNWQEVREQVINENILQQRTVSSSNKLYQELSSRLKNLTDDEIAYLCSADNKAQYQLIWLAICKRYAFIQDFAIEVVHEAVLTLKMSITYDNYNIFFSSKLVTFDELDMIADSTKNKIRQVIFRMLNELNIVDTDGVIQTMVIDQTVKEFIRQDDINYLRIYPIYNSQELKVENA